MSRLNSFNQWCREPAHVYIVLLDYIHSRDSVDQLIYLGYNISGCSEKSAEESSKQNRTEHARALSHIKQRYIELRVFDIIAKWLDGLQLLDSCICRSILPAVFTFFRIVNLKSEWEWFIRKKWKFMGLSLFKRTSLICSLILSCSCLSVTPTCIHYSVTKPTNDGIHSTFFSLQLTFDGTLYMFFQNYNQQFDWLK